MGKERERKILFSVTEDEHLTREKWERFKLIARSRGETWIAILRRTVDRYLEDADKEQR